MLGRRDWKQAAIAGLCAFAASLVVLRHGIAVTPDSWGYWQGSVSLLEGRGYAFLYGPPIESWPPLYSLYLAGWQAVFGVSGATLVLATAVTIGLSALAWALWLAFLVRSGDDGRRRIVPLAWIVATLVLSASPLFSESLFHALLPAVLVASTLTWNASSPRALLRASLALGVSLAAALLVRNATLALLPACALTLLAFSPAPPRWRVAAVSLFTAVALLPWWGVRRALEQGGSHDFVLGGRAGFLETTRQLAEGLGEHVASGLVGVPLALALVLALWLVPAERWSVPPALLANVRRLSLYVAAVCAGLWALFTITSLGGRLGGRFTLFAALALVPVFLWLCGGLADRRLRAAIATILLFTPVSLLAWRAWRGAVPADVAPDSDRFRQVVGLSTAISSRHLEQPIFRDGDRLYVAPPISDAHRGRFERWRRTGR